MNTCKECGANTKPENIVELKISLNGEQKDLVKCQSFVGVAIIDEGESLSAGSLIIGGFSPASAQAIHECLPQLHREFVDTVTESFAKEFIEDLVKGNKMSAADLFSKILGL